MQMLEEQSKQCSAFQDSNNFQGDKRLNPERELSSMAPSEEQDISINLNKEVFQDNSRTHDLKSLNRVISKIQKEDQ